MLSQRHYVVTFRLVYLHREGMEENGDQSYLCWWRLHQKTCQVWAFHQTYGEWIVAVGVGCGCCKTCGALSCLQTGWILAGTEIPGCGYKGSLFQLCNISGAGIAQWLEHRTRDWKVAGSNPCWNGGRIFFSRVDFLCWLLFRYPFHPRVTTVARKKSRSFCQKCRWQVTAKHAYTLRMWILLNRASALVTTCP